MMTTCSRCTIEKPQAEFYRKSTGAHGYTTTCKKCIRSAATGWYVNNRERVKTRNLLLRYGIDYATVQALLLAQHGRCALCGDAFTKSGPCVDHDHETGSVRGLLHRGCNIALGTVERVGPEAFAAYLDRAARARLSVVK